MIQLIACISAILKFSRNSRVSFMNSKRQLLRIVCKRHFHKLPDEKSSPWITRAPGGTTLTWKPLKSHLSQVICGKPMGYVINSNNLEDLNVMMFESYKVFTIGSRGGGGVVGAWSSILATIYDNYMHIFLFFIITDKMRPFWAFK